MFSQAFELERDVVDLGESERKRESRFRSGGGGDHCA